MISFLDGGLLRQIQAIFTCYLGSLLTGFSVAFSAIAIPGIKLDRAQQLSFVGSIEVSDANLSWFGKFFSNFPGDVLISCLPASTVAVGMMIGCLLGGILGGKYGPKKTIQMSSLFGITGWSLMIFSSKFYLLISGRIIVGVGCAFTTANAPLLVAQYSNQKQRGTFLSLYALMIGFGILLCYSLGAVLHWRYVACAPPAIYIFLAFSLCFVPESPIWLLTHKGETLASEALKWLR